MCKRGDRVQDSHEEQKFCMTTLDWVEDLTQSVWNVWITWKLYIQMKTMLFLMKKIEIKPYINRESKIDELTIKLYSCHNINMKFLVVVTPPYIYQFLIQSWYNTPVYIVLVSTLELILEVSDCFFEHQYILAPL